MELDFAVLYRMLLSLLCADGRGELFFGDNGQLAFDAFRSCAVGKKMPVTYFELPLVGKPSYDLQVCIGRENLDAGTRMPEAAPQGAQALLDWLIDKGDDCVGIDCAFDIGEGDITTPQLITLMRKGTLGDADGFFAAAGCVEAASRWRAVGERVPEGWFPWYVGLCSRRAGNPVRLDYSVSQQLKNAYTKDVSLLEDHLSQMGYRTSADELDLCGELLTMPFGLNIQLDLLEDGSIGSVFGYNLSMGHMGAIKARESIREGELGHALSFIEHLGLADNRWRQLDGCCLGLGFPLHGEQSLIALQCAPTFVKVRMTPDGPLDAKVYLMSTATVLKR